MDPNKIDPLGNKDFFDLGPIDRAEAFAHSNSLGGGIPGHVLGYGLVPWSYVFEGGLKAMNYLFPIPEHRAVSPRIVELPVEKPTQQQLVRELVADMSGRGRGRSRGRPYTRGRERQIANTLRQRAVTRALRNGARQLARQTRNISARSRSVPASSRVFRVRRQRSASMMSRANNSGMKFASETGKKMIRSLYAPPTQFQGTYSTGTYMKMKHRKNWNELHFRVPIGDISLNYALDELLPTTNITLADGNTNIAASYFLGGNCAYMPEPVYDMVVLFQFIKWASACFEFTPRIQNGTSNGVGITWGFSADPCYPEDHAFIHSTSDPIGNGYAPAENQVKPMDGSTQFPCWVPTSCYDATSKLDKKWRFTNGADVVTGLYNPSDPSATQRQTYSGVLLMSGNSNARAGDSGTELSVLLGTLWIKGVLHLREFAPSATTDVTFSRAMRSLNSIGGHRFIKHYLKKLAQILKNYGREKIRFVDGKVLYAKRKKPLVPLKDDDAFVDRFVKFMDEKELKSPQSVVTEGDDDKDNKEFVDLGPTFRPQFPVIGVNVGKKEDSFFRRSTTPVQGLTKMKKTILPEAE